MAVKIVDASALAALLFGEPEADAVADGLQDASLVAPALLGFEIANECLKKLRRHPEQRDALLAGLGLYELMSIEIVEVDEVETLQLAEAFGLTSYDAAYLLLARVLAADLVTLDRRLQTAGTTRIRGRRTAFGSSRSTPRLRSAENQRGNRDPDSPPKPK
jgi:predicted nucleic acid-binding protein